MRVPAGWRFGIDGVGKTLTVCRVDKRAPAQIAAARELRIDGAKFLSNGLLQYVRGNGMRFVPYRQGTFQFEEAFPVSGAIGDATRVAWLEGSQKQKVLVVRALATAAEQRFQVPPMEDVYYLAPVAFMGRSIVFTKSFNLVVFDLEKGEWLSMYLSGPIRHISNRRVYVEGEGWKERYLYAHDPVTARRTNLGIWYETDWHSVRGRHFHAVFSEDRMLMLHKGSLVLLDLEARTSAETEQIIWNSPQANKRLRQAERIVPTIKNVESWGEVPEEQLFRRLVEDCGPRAIPLLAQILESNSSKKVDKGTAALMVKTRSPDALPYVTKAILENQDSWLAIDLSRMLGRIPSPATRSFLAERIRAIGPANSFTEPLGYIGLPEDLPLLRAALQDETNQNLLQYGNQAASRIETRNRLKEVFKQASGER